MVARMLSLFLAAALAAPTDADPPAGGVSESLARERSSSISAVRYALTFTIPADRSAPVQGR